MFERDGDGDVTPGIGISATSRLLAQLGAARAAIVDLDGTMVDTAPDFLVAANAVRAEHGLTPWALKEVADCIGKGPEQLVRRLLEELHPAVLAQRFDAALASFTRHYEAANGRHGGVYPGVHQGLAALRGAGLRLACVTNKPHAQALRLLEHTGLLPLFELVYGGDSFARRKPDPLPIRRACETFGLAGGNVVLIGDSCNDAQAGRAAGCEVLLVPYGYNHGASVASSQADAVVADLAAAARLILSRASRTHL